MIDTSFLTGTPPPATPLLNPLDIQARKIAVRNALAAGALQDQQIQGATLANQMTQQQIADMHADRAGQTAYWNAASPAPGVSAGIAPGGAPLPTAPAFDPAAAPAPSPAGAPLSPIQQQGANLGASLDAATGAPPAPGAQSAGAAPAGQPGGSTAPAAAPVQRPPIPTMGQLVGTYHMTPQGASGMIQQFQAIQAKSADIAQSQATAAKATEETNALIQQHASDMANMIVKATPPGQAPNPQLVAWHLQEFASLGDQEKAKALQIQQHLAQLAPADQLPFIQTLAGTTKTIEANAAADTAAGKVQTSNREAANQARAQSLSALGAAPNGAAYGAIWQKLSPELRADPAIPNPAQWTAQTPALIRNLGMSSQEQTTTRQAAIRDAQTAANENTARGQEQQNIGLRTQEFNQRYSPAGVAIAPVDLPRIQAIHNGDIPAPSPRSAGYQKTMDQVYSLDKPGDAYTQARYTTNQNFLTKGDSDRVAGIATALGHLDRAQTNSAALGWSPTQSLNITGTQHAYHTDVDFLSGEIGKFIKNNEMTQAEGARIIGNMNSSLQGTRDAGLSEAKDLMGGKFQTMRQKYVNGAGREMPLSLFDKPTQQRLITQGLVAAPGAPNAPSAIPASAAPAAHGVPDLGSTFNGGKVLKVTRIN